MSSIHLILDEMIGKRLNKILQLIKEKPSITQREIHEITDISMSTIKRILPRLQERGVLERIGNKRTGKWVIKS